MRQKDNEQTLCGVRVLALLTEMACLGGGVGVGGRQAGKQGRSSWCTAPCIVCALVDNVLIFYLFTVFYTGKEGKQSWLSVIQTESSTSKFSVDCENEKCVCLP